MSKKLTKSKSSKANSFASLASDPGESEELLEQQQADQGRVLEELRQRELAIEQELAEVDADGRVAEFLSQFQNPRQSPVNSPFDPSVHKTRRYGVIKEQDAANIETSIFQRLRESMFKTGKGGMFMFGTPDSVVLNLLLRMYNENIIRIAKGIPHPPPTLSAMLGVLHMNDGKIYITISEDPREDDHYPKKVQLIYTLLKYTNCNVIYPEENDDDSEVRSAFSSTWISLFPKIPFVYRDLDRSPVACLSSDEHGRTNNGLILDTWQRKGGSTYDFDRTIMSDPINVHFVHSLKYLVGRRPENPGAQNSMFPPIKKTAGDGRVGFYECANGSTCSEAKIFSYIHQHYDQLTGPDVRVVQRPSRRITRSQPEQISPAEATFRNIRGYGAYWISSKNPTKHIIENYNYKLDPNDKFITESTEIMNIIKGNVPQFMTAHVNTPQFGYFAQLFALPCPGCFLNYNNYIKNTMTSYNLSTCVKTRKGKLYASGGKRRRLNKTTRKSVRTNGKHTRKCRCRTCRGGTKRMRK